MGIKQTAFDPTGLDNDLLAHEHGFADTTDIPKIADIRTRYELAAKALGSKRRVKLRIRLK